MIILKGKLKGNGPVILTAVPAWSVADDHALDVCR
jgi:hypothetical protein